MPPWTMQDEHVCTIERGYACRIAGVECERHALHRARRRYAGHESARVFVPVSIDLEQLVQPRRDVAERRNRGSQFDCIAEASAVVL